MAFDSELQRLLARSQDVVMTMKTFIEDLGTCCVASTTEKLAGLSIQFDLHRQVNRNTLSLELRGGIRQRWRFNQELYLHVILHFSDATPKKFTLG